MYHENPTLQQNDCIDNTINFDFLRSEIEILTKEGISTYKTLCEEIIKIIISKNSNKIIVSTSKPDI